MNKLSILTSPYNSMPYMIIDVSSIAYRVYYTLKDLSSKERKTGVIFGFLNQILNLAKTFKTNKFVFCFDSRKSFRKALYPEYKGNRGEKDLEELEELKDLFRQVNELRGEVLPNLGFRNIFCKTGYESDDLIFFITDQNKQAPYIIVSNDRDLLQLITYDISFYNFTSSDLIHKEEFSKRYYGLAPWWYGEMKAIAGCDTDNVKGIVGVGEKTAFKYLRGLLDKGRLLDKIKSKEGQDIIKRNYKLVILPFKRGKDPECILLNNGGFKKGDFIDVFHKYDFISFLRKDKLSEWEEYFKFI